MKPDRQLRLFIALGGSSALALALNLLTAVLVARLLGPSGFGQWTLIVAAGALLTSMAGNWTQSAMVRFGCEEWETHRTLSRTLGSRLPLMAVSAGLAFILLVAQPGQWLTRWFGIDVGHWWLAGLYSLSLWLAAEAQATFRASDRLHIQARLAPVGRAVALAALAPLFWRGSRSLPIVTIVLTVPVIVVWGSAWGIALYRAGVRLRELIPHDTWRYVRYAWWVLPAFAVGYVNDYGDHILLRVLSSAADVGIFGLANQAFAAMLVANGLLTTVLLPRLIVGQMRAPETTSLYLREVAPTLLTLWMIASLWVVALAPPILVLMGGDAFISAAGVLSILCVAIPASVINQLYGVLLDVQQRLGIVLTYSIAMAAVNVMLSLMLIPSYGATGSAVGTAASYIAGQWLYLRDQHRWVALPRAAVTSLWATGLALGLMQVAITDSLAMRLVWGVAATGAVAFVARRVGAVNASVLARILSGPLAPLAPAVTRALAAPVA